MGLGGGMRSTDGLLVDIVILT